MEVYIAPEDDAIFNHPMQNKPGDTNVTGATANLTCDDEVVEGQDDYGVANEVVITASVPKT